jgi:urease subunit alpha
MRLNDALPDIRVDSQTFDVFVDGALATSEPAREVKLNRLYMLR